MQLVLPDDYAYVLLTASSYAFLNVYQSRNVSIQRRAAGIKYPQVYADKAQEDANPAAFKFNCAQRAHYNTLESANGVLFGTLVTGLRYPMLATGMGVLYFIGRIIYTRGYTAQGPDGRNKSGGILGGGMPYLFALSTALTAFQMLGLKLF
ncbi:hypothetical protein FRB96_000292 [Tulasnella sp. 330]|nr:hypothetical protein FRB96_000292 [Tulasnella sp. 330]KAG8882273.1 hypothetical protein FRB97_008476 [Tulasnella sp. 331]KAG8886864.1 hypothetical protein FRB98_000890 [Tulasnella sp. 332]